MVRSIRGAITVKENTREAILEGAGELLARVLEENKVRHETMVSVIFTATADLDKVYPAVAARDMGLTDVPLSCMQELNVENSLPKCIRVLVTFNTDKELTEIKHVYLRDAVKLRPDLVK